MGRLWLLVMKCNYKVLHRQLKDQFIHGLNDTDMLGKIIKGLTKIHESTEIPNENMLSWAKELKQKSPIHHHEQPHRGKGI